MAENYIPLAPCQNAAFYNKYLTAHPLTTGLMLRNLNIAPFIGNWTEKYVPTMAILATYGRSLVLGYTRPEPEQCYTVTMGELMAPFLNRDICLGQVQAREMLIASVKALILSPVTLRIVTRGTQESFSVNVAAVNDPAIESLFTPAAIGTLGAFADGDRNCGCIEAAIRVLYFLALTSIEIYKIGGLPLVANTTVSVCKRGIVSQDFLRKIENGIQLDLGSTVELNYAAIVAFYQFYGTGIKDDTIAEVQTSWSALIPPQALRLSLTVQQLAGSGLTSFTTVGRAIKKYPTFVWHKVAHLYQIEWDKYITAVGTVGGNQYYGFKKDLGVAKSTNYKSLTYVAKELLIKVNGESALSRYRGWPTRVAHQGVVDQWILDFVNSQGDIVNNVPENDEAGRVGDMMAAVNLNVNNELFA